MTAETSTYSQISGHLKTAIQMHESGGPEAAGKIRSTLDTALAIVEADTEASGPGSDNPAFYAIIAAAHVTKQGPAYIEPVFGHVRRSVMEGPETAPDFSWKLGQLARDAQRYGLGDEYAAGIFEEGRAKVRSLPEPGERVRKLAGIAVQSYGAQGDSDYVREIIEEGREINEQQVEDTAEQTELFINLAKTANSTRQPRELARDILLRAYLNRSFPREASTTSAEDAVEGAHDLRQVIRTCVELDYTELSVQFATLATESIKNISGRTPRERHGLLNATLWEAGLPEEFTAGGLVAKQPLSFVFKPARRPLNITGTIAPH